MAKRSMFVLSRLEIRGRTLLSLFVAVILLTSDLAGAQPKRNSGDFQPGDRVEVKIGAKWQTAEVVKLRPPAMAEVQLTESRGPRKLTVPLRNVRAPGTTAPEPINRPDEPQKADTAESRTWTDSTGQYTVDAVLEEFKDGQVTLRRIDGKTVVLPIERLSQADRDFLTQMTNRDEESAEKILREFLIAMTLGDRETGRKLIVPTPAAPILWTGEHPPREAADEVRQHFQSLDLRRLQVGEQLSVPGGQQKMIGPTDVNERRVMLAARDAPLPFILVKLPEGWRVDATPLIAARQAAARAKIEADNPETTEMIDDVTWHEVSASQGRYRVSMPAKATQHDQTSPTSQGPVRFVIYKAAGDGMFWNFNLITYPQAVIDANPEPVKLLELLAAANLKKLGSQQDALITLDAGGVPAIEQRLHYPAGRNSAGEYAAGSAVHRMYWIKNQVCWLFVDVADAARQADPNRVQAIVNRFFESFTTQNDAP